MKLDNIIAERINKTIYRDGNKCIKVFDESYSKADVLKDEEISRILLVPDVILYPSPIRRPGIQSASSPRKGSTASGRTAAGIFPSIITLASFLLISPPPPADRVILSPFCLVRKTGNIPILS